MNVPEITALSQISAEQRADEGSVIINGHRYRYVVYETDSEGTVLPAQTTYTVSQSLLSAYVNDLQKKEHLSLTNRVTVIDAPEEPLASEQLEEATIQTIAPSFTAHCPQTVQNLWDAAIMPNEAANRLALPRKPKEYIDYCARIAERTAPHIALERASTPGARSLPVGSPRREALPTARSLPQTHTRRFFPEPRPQDLDADGASSETSSVGTFTSAEEGATTALDYAIHARMGAEAREHEIIRGVVTASSVRRTGRVLDPMENIHGIDFLKMIQEEGTLERRIAADKRIQDVVKELARNYLKQEPTATLDQARELLA